MAISRISVTRDDEPVSSTCCDVATPGRETRAATPSAMASATRTVARREAPPSARSARLGVLEFSTRQCTLADARQTPWVTPSRAPARCAPQGPPPRAFLSFSLLSPLSPLVFRRRHDSGYVLAVPVEI